jgi:hypothetical protein
MLMMFRYLVLLQIHLNKRRWIRNFKLKELKSEEFSIGKCQNIFTKFLKILSSHWITILFPLLWFSLYSFLILIVHIVFGFVCSVDSFFYMRLIHGAGVLLICSCIALFLIFDFIINISLIVKCKCKQIYLNNDPYHYRLDMIIILITIPLCIVWFFATLPQIIIASLIDVLIFSGFLISGFLAFLITILKRFLYFFKNRSNKNNKSGNWKVSDVMNEKLIELFTEYCEFEWSSENILLKRQIAAYKKMILVGDRKTICNKIKIQFLLRNSPLEVNCPQKILEGVVKQIEEENFGEELFSELEKMIDLNLTDTISRFFFSDLYKSYLIDIKNTEKTIGL